MSTSNVFFRGISNGLDSLAGNNNSRSRAYNHGFYHNLSGLFRHRKFFSRNEEDTQSESTRVIVQCNKDRFGLPGLYDD